MAEEGGEGVEEEVEDEVGPVAGVAEAEPAEGTIGEKKGIEVPREERKVENRQNGEAEESAHGLAGVV